ncbi:MAG: malectin [Chloroflexota bacterium]|nr:malectin [Chloroflexota bacterium]
MQKLTPSARPQRSMRSTLVTLCVALLLVVVAGGTLLSTNFARQVAYAAAANSAVTTFRNDNAHTGQYPNETTLNTSNVNQSQFGKRVSYPVDGQVYTQPLYLPNLSIGGQVHNVVFAATENDSVYAFDADQTSAVAPLWKTSLLPSGATAVPYAAVSCGDLIPIIGITGTPVIDPSTNTMYIVAYSQENGGLVYRLHALDVTTGHDKSAPVVIQGSAAGTGPGSSNGTVTFDAHLERQRVALIMSGGKVYVAFASFCDNGNYHGWVFSYTYNGSSFQQVNTYLTTPAGIQASIWGGDGALVTDNNGNFYIMTGNGTFNANTGGNDVGDSFVRLNAQLQRQDYFTPFNQSCLSAGDQDLGSGAPLLITGSNALIGGGKEGRPYVVSTTNMGQYTSDPNLTCNGSAEENRTNVDKIQQELPPGTTGPIFSTPAFWNGPNGQYVYLSSVNSPTKAYSWSNGKLSTTPTSATAVSFGFTGGDPVVSSNGTAPGTGILWTIGPDTILRAYDASNLGNELYDSNQNASRDGISGYVKFSTPAVANGEVFVGTSANLAIFGIISSTPPPSPTPIPGGIQINSGGSASGTFVADTDFTGGSTVSVTKAIDTSGVSNPAPQAVYQSNRYGTFSYSVPGLTAGKSYTVRLHFAETYWTAAGQRTFNVSINGQQVLTNFDIVASAGAANKATVQQFTATADSTGKITLQFTTVKDNAQVNGIEILGGSAPPTPTPTSTPPPNGVRINSGGSASGTFVADTDFTGGSTASVTKAIDTSGVSNPAPQAVYQSNRVGTSFSYAVPGLTAGKSYTVRLHFAETYWTAVGARTFNVSINGQQVLTNFDIVAAAGAANKAVVEQFTATADSTGKITLQFTTVKDNAQVNGIEIL